MKEIYKCMQIVSVQLGVFSQIEYTSVPNPQLEK